MIYGVEDDDQAEQQDLIKPIRNRYLIFIPEDVEVLGHGADNIPVLQNPEIPGENVPFDCEIPVFRDDIILFHQEREPSFDSRHQLIVHMDFIERKEPEKLLFDEGKRPSMIVIKPELFPEGKKFLLHLINDASVFTENIETVADGNHFLVDVEFFHVLLLFFLWQRSPCGQVQLIPFLARDFDSRRFHKLP